MTCIKVDSGSIYKLFQEVGAGKGCQRQSASVNIDENKATKDPAIITNAFNDFFDNVNSEIKEPITHSNHDKLKDSLFKQNFLGCIICNPNYNREKSFKYLFNVDVSKAIGTDNSVRDF